MKIFKPDAVDFKKLSAQQQLDVRCKLTKETFGCQGAYGRNSHCLFCALDSIENYKAWKAQQPKNELVKWPISSKDRFFVLPRVFVNAMSNKWKKRFLSLLNEAQYVNRATVDMVDYKFRVSVTKNGKYVKMPEIFKRG